MRSLEINGEGELTWKMTVKTECVCVPVGLSITVACLCASKRYYVMQFYDYIDILLQKISITVFKNFRYRHF